MRPLRTLSPALFLLILTGCPADRHEAPPETPSGPAPGAGVVDDEALEPRRVELRRVDGARVIGSAMLTPRDTAVEVVVTLRESEPSANHAVRLYAGTCGEAGAILAELAPIRTDATGSGASQQVVQQLPRTVFGGRTVILVQPPNGVVAGPPLACGEVGTGDALR